ncbi:hypothetical protein VTK56DRAFT_4900 [Thermocarpiscus australiensis]
MDALPPFLSREPMQGDPPCHWADFVSPKLRRFPHGDGFITWDEFLGHGAEGSVSAVRFGDARDVGPLALKVFFRPGPLGSFDSSRRDHGMWSLEYEALAVAVLEKVCSGLRASRWPVHVPAQRITRLDALASLYACSVEGRQSRVYDKLPPEQRVSLSALFEATRVRTCFGWVALRGQDVIHLNRTIRFGRYRPEKGDIVPAYFEPDRHYFGIVYEYIPPSEPEPDALQRQIDFFRYAGFNCFQPANPENWIGPGIKLDFGDFHTPVDPRFEGAGYYATPTTAKYILDLEEPTGRDWEEIEPELEAYREKSQRLRALSWAVERAFCAHYYAGDKRQPHPSRVSTRLPEAALCAVRVADIEPPVLRKAWREYRRLKLKYLEALAEKESQGSKDDEDGSLSCSE